MLTMRTDVGAVAKEFDRLLKLEIGVDNWRRVILANEDEPWGSWICHSHDFCDANVLFAQAVANVEGWTLDEATSEILESDNGWDAWQTWRINALKFLKSHQ